MSPNQKRLLLAAAFVAVLGTVIYLWWNAPVRAATRALLAAVDSVQISGGESSLARQGKAARLGRALADPVDIKFQEAGRDGAWSAESLQARYLSGAVSAKSISARIEDPSGELSEAGSVLITAMLHAEYSGQGGGATKVIGRLCRWEMVKEGGRWLIASFRETEAAE